MLTLAEILELALPPETRVAAGRDRLAAEVSWAVSMRSRAPGFEGLSRGELAIVNPRNLEQIDDQLTLARLIDQIAPAGIAGIAVSGPADPAARQAAERARVALLEMPAGASSREIEQRVNKLVSARREELRRQEQDIFQDLVGSVVAGEGVQGIASRLAASLGATVLMLNGEIAPVAWAEGARDGAPVPAAAALVLESWPDLARLADQEGPAADGLLFRGAWGIAAASVTCAGGEVLHVAALAPAARARERMRIGAARAAQAWALEVAREAGRGGPSVDAQASGFVRLALSGGYPSEDAARQAARSAGLDASGKPFAIIVASEGGPANAPPTASERVLRSAAREARQPEASAVVQGAAAMVLNCDIGTAEAIASRACLRLAALGATPRAVVASSGDSVARLARLFAAAEATLQEPSAFAQSPVYTLRGESWRDTLLEIGETEPLRAFRDAWLADLAAHDARHRGQLVATLEAYLDSHCSPTAASALLHVHRNTLLYRLRRIAQISGRDPDDPDVRFAFQCALTLDRAFGRGRKP